jgi:hAT family C-terminal dimerisation region
MMKMALPVLIRRRMYLMTLIDPGYEIFGATLTQLSMYQTTGQPLHGGVYVMLMLMSLCHLTSYLKVNAHCYPVWASLAWDYLSIMASSVSSERAFSHGRITISKRRSRLKGDIVEALQCIKCAIRNDLLFREAAPSSSVEAELELEDGEDHSQGDEDEEGEGDWHEFLIEEDDDKQDSDVMSDID